MNTTATVEVVNRLGEVRREGPYPEWLAHVKARAWQELGADAAVLVGSSRHIVARYPAAR